VRDEISDRILASFEAITELQKRLQSGSLLKDYEFQPPVMVSHAKDHATDRDRLQRYASNVIGARIQQVRISFIMKTWFFIKLYLDSLENDNPFALPFAARAQIETFALVKDTLFIVSRHKGSHAKDFVTRVVLVDEALVKAMYGTRSEQIKDLLEQLGPSKLRAMSAEDRETMQARQIMARIERVRKISEYKDILTDYERICEYVHPNYAQNNLLLVPSKTDRRLIRLSCTDPLALRNALAATIRPMALSANGTVDAFEKLDDPFPGSISGS
jgi:hypothetical protein